MFQMFQIATNDNYLKIGPIFLVETNFYKVFIVTSEPEYCNDDVYTLVMIHSSYWLNKTFAYVMKIYNLYIHI